MRLKFTYLEISLAVLLVAYAAMWTFLGPGFETTLLKVPVAILFAIAAVRWSRRIVRASIWRLRNRLIVTYIFVALVPILLILLLTDLAIAIASGQMAVYLVAEELQSRTNSVAGTMESLLRTKASREDWNWTANLFQGWFPGLVLHSRQGVFPPSGALPEPPRAWEPTRGLVLKDGLVFGWAIVTVDGERATAVFPVSGRLLGDLAPGIGETNIFHRGDRQGGRLSLLHETPGQADAPRNRLPRGANRFDRETFGYRLEPVDVWDQPGKAEMKLIVTLTRPSALVRAVFPPDLEWQSGGALAFFYAVAIVFIVAELIALAIGLSLTRTITGAVHNLYEGTLRVMSGDFTHRIPARGGDQLQELGVSFNRMTENLQRLIQVEKEKERLHNELTIAREVQDQLYPKDLPASRTLEIDATRRPARMVSGDYYDYRQLPDGRIVFAMGDVSGKGISAALLMSAIQSSFRTQLAATAEHSAAEAPSCVSTAVLTGQINRHLHSSTSPEKFATMFLGIYDDRLSTLSYTNAGHLPPILFRKGEASRLDVNGLVIGAFSFAQYAESTLPLEPGDLLVFFTDGISEAEDAYGEMFGEERLIDIMQPCVSQPPAEIAAKVTEAVEQWTGSPELQDDMTLLLVRRLK